MLVSTTEFIAATCMQMDFTATLILVCYQTKPDLEAIVASIFMRWRTLKGN